MIQRKQLTREQAIPKIKHYCEYQERSQREVKEKLYGLGLWKKDVEELTSLMIEEGYLNEEKFAIAFASGKFRINHWGRTKIRWELKQKQVSEYCIKKAMEGVDDKSYLETLNKLAAKKWKQLEVEKNKAVKMRKLHDYLLQKGYEYEFIKQVEVI